MEFLPAPDRPRPPLGEVHVWRADLDAAGWPRPDGLPADERERAARMLRAEPRRRWIVSRWALRQVLARYLGQAPAEIEIGRDGGGKPRLAAAAGRLEFNLSHSDALALVAVSGDRPVGVDVERIAPERDLIALAERTLAEDDAAAVRSAPPAGRALVFYELWARHEASLKCLGRGLGPPVEEGAVTIETLRLDPGYAAAVAVAGVAGVPLRGLSIGPTAT